MSPVAVRCRGIFAKIEKILENVLRIQKKVVSLHQKQTRTQNIMSTIKLGTINLGEKVIVSDPCYDMNIRHKSEINILPGEYECMVSRGGGECGDIVSSLEVKRKGSHIIAETYLSSILADSGQVGIFDYTHYEMYHSMDGACKKQNDEWYRKACGITLSDDLAGTMYGLGVVSRSGYGDGCYDVKVGTDKDGNVAYICVDFD